jgi:hypothetical protein
LAHLRTAQPTETNCWPNISRSPFFFFFRSLPAGARMSGSPLPPAPPCPSQQRRPPAVSHVPRASLSFKPHHKGVVKAPFTPPPSILLVTPSQAPPLDGNQGRRPPMAIDGHCCPTVAPPPLLAL